MEATCRSKLSDALIRALDRAIRYDVEAIDTSAFLLTIAWADRDVRDRS